MELRQLRHFVAVADCLHFGRAAERIGITQPPLSQSIQALERELGAPLFTRTKHSVAMTEFGAAWLSHVQEALSRVHDLRSTARRLIEGHEGTLNVSFVSMVDYSILPALVSRYQQDHPGVSLRLSEATSDAQLDGLLAGTIDAGLIVAADESELSGELSYRKLFCEPLIAAVPERWIDDHRMTLRQGKIAKDDLAASPIILFPRRVSAAFHDMVMRFLASSRLTPKIVQEAVQMQTIVSLVSAGMGCALVPKSIGNLRRPGVLYCAIAGSDAPQLETGVAWRAKSTSPTLQRFVEMAEAIASNELS